LQLKLSSKAIIKLLEDMGALSHGRGDLQNKIYNHDVYSKNDLSIILASLGYELVTFSNQKVLESNLNTYFTLSKKDEYYITKKSDVETNYYDLDYNVVPKLKESDIKELLLIKSFINSRNSIYSIGLNWFWKLTLTHKKIFTIVFFISFLLSFIAILVPLFISLFYSQMIPAIESDIHLGLLVGTGILLVLNFGLKLLRTLLITRSSYQLGSQIVRQVFRRILYLPPLYTEIASISSQISRIRDFESIRFFIGKGSQNIYDLPFTILLIFAMFYFAGNAAWVPVAALVLFFLLGIASYPYVKRFNSHVSSSSTEFQQFLLELTTQLENIQGYQGKRQWPNRFEQYLSNYLRSSHSVTVLYSVINTISGLIVNLSGLLTIVIGVHQVIEGRMTSGELMASLILVWRILGPIRTGFGSISQINKVRESIKQLDRFMNLKQEQKHLNYDQSELTVEGPIEFSNVSLRYSKDSLYALLNINFKISKNQTLGILGHGGSGKSSILKLVLSLYAIPIGRLLINSQNISQFNPINIRENIGYLEQRPKIINCSLGDFLKIAEKDLKKEEVVNCISTLKLENLFSSLEKGLNTKMEDLSLTTNIGLTKKLILLKIFVNQSKIVLLDEPLMGLARNDYDAVLNWLIEQKNKLTMIIVSNDPQLLQLTDVAIILEKGRIIEQGSPSVLVKQFLQKSA